MYGIGVAIGLGDVGVCVPSFSLFLGESSLLELPPIFYGKEIAVVSTCAVLVAVSGVSSCVFCRAVFPAMASIVFINI